jgi:hypothetical protein
MPRTRLQNEIEQNSSMTVTPKLIYHYGSFGEVITPREAGLLLGGLSRDAVIAWLRLKKCPFGELIENYHFWKDSRNYHIVKDRLCELFGILPKSNNVKGDSK